MGRWTTEAGVNIHIPGFGDIFARVKRSEEKEVLHRIGDLFGQSKGETTTLDEKKVIYESILSNLVSLSDEDFVGSIQKGIGGLQEELLRDQIRKQEREADYALTRAENKIRLRLYQEALEILESIKLDYPETDEVKTGRIDEKIVEVEHEIDKLRLTVQRGPQLRQVRVEQAFLVLQTQIKEQVQRQNSSLPIQEESYQEAFKNFDALVKQYEDREIVEELLRYVVEVQRDQSVDGRSRSESLRWLQQVLQDLRNTATELGDQQEEHVKNLLVRIQDFLQHARDTQISRQDKFMYYERAMDTLYSILSTYGHTQIAQEILLDKEIEGIQRSVLETELQGAEEELEREKKEGEAFRLLSSTYVAIQRAKRDKTIRLSEKINVYEEGLKILEKIISDHKGTEVAEKLKKDEPIGNIKRSELEQELRNLKQIHEREESERVVSELFLEASQVIESARKEERWLLERVELYEKGLGILEEIISDYKGTKVEEKLSKDEKLENIKKSDIERELKVIKEQQQGEERKVEGLFTDMRTLYQKGENSKRLEEKVKYYQEALGKLEELIKQYPGTKLGQKLSQDECVEKIQRSVLKTELENAKEAQKKEEPIVKQKELEEKQKREEEANMLFSDAADLIRQAKSRQTPLSDKVLKYGASLGILEQIISDYKGTRIAGRLSKDKKLEKLEKKLQTLKQRLKRDKEELEESLYYSSQGFGGLFQIFIISILRGFRNFFDFKGRANRVEFFCWFLFSSFVFLFSLSFFSEDSNVRSLENDSILFLVYLVCIMSVFVRRLHDINKSGLYYPLWLTLWILLVWLIDRNETSDSSIIAKGFAVLFILLPWLILMLIWTWRWLMRKGDLEENSFGMSRNIE